ncbi:serine/threonine-protein phosphatase PGAM5, mitochondrial-like [Liolophura sinensis]|uniref:serine/threonine-protein phosphatase PGAM5, mitochondrial-like n=1 Tax=Liolophura sinensis TaxID=3198878 RepID=UPI0031581BF5
MTWRQRAQGLGKVVVGVSAVTGALVAIYLQKKSPEDRIAATSWTTNFKPSIIWDSNWDKREPDSLVKVSKDNPDPKQQKDYENLVMKNTPKATRHLILIRHGNYNLDGETDQMRYLTKLGREQAELTGLRLQALNKQYLKLVSSTMTRAVETADIILKSLPKDLPVERSDLLREGAPIPPEPPLGSWRPEKQQFFEDGARIEAAFRHYFHRASPDQTTDSYEIIVCHANVIRYFVCRALQFPPEGWLRMSLNHGSITWVTIRPSGRVVLRALGEAGFMPPAKISSM